MNWILKMLCKPRFRCPHLEIQLQRPLWTSKQIVWGITQIYHTQGQDGNHTNVGIINTLQTLTFPIVHISVTCI